MPAIRSLTSNYTTSTAGTTITIPVPACSENDLLLVSLVSDTGTATSTWSLPTGWSLFMRSLNTCQHDIFFKIASANEPANYTFTRSAAETFNGRMISIMDVNTAAPFGAPPANTGLITIGVDATARTFTRTAGGSGSFIADGFQTGMTIVTWGFTNAGNNTTRVIQSVTATVITVTSGTGLVTETAAANRFITQGVATVQSQAAAIKYTLPQITTTVNNCLILYCVSNSGVGVPSIIEGPVSLITGEDGTAESGGEGWSFKTTAGATPTNVTCSNIATGAGVKMTIQISPPSSGAQVIPAFCAGDNSIYVDPIHGTTAYNNNASLSATFDTLISTTLAGNPVADATIAAIADYGLNSFHSVGQVSSINNATSWGGAALDLAAENVVNATNKNILVHTGPNNPSHIQRFAPAASRRGIAIVLLSTAGNWKAWHVHGARTAWEASRDVPLIINPANTSGVIDSVGNLNPAAIDVFGFAVAGTGVGSTLWQFYSLWVLDTTIICGGGPNSPISISGIVTAASTGHERRSIIQQGANQAIIYQPIQIGNGGGEVAYLDLNATAIEFPRQYNLSLLQINYCSVDNVAGITYYAGPNDTIKHRNSIISSPSKYHWRFHPSSSTSAAYDFSGLTIIGAGDIQLVANLPLSGISWINCDGFNSAGAYLNNCTIRNSNSTVALTVDSPTAMSRITNCLFENNNRAIRITTAGTYTFDNIRFSGNTYDIENASTGTVTINCINDSNPSTYINTNGGTTVINNAVPIQIKCINKDNQPLSGIRVYVEKSSDKSQILNSTTNSQGIVSTNYNYLTDTLININIRRSTIGATRYLPYNTTGTITSSGFNLTVVLYEDIIAPNS